METGQQSLASTTLIKLLDKHIQETKEKFPEVAYDFPGLDYESEDEDDTSESP